MKTAVVGGTGYGAVELIRLLDKHPMVQLESIVSHSQSGTEIHAVYPHLSNIVHLTMDEWNIQNLHQQVDIVFFATPAGVSKELLPQCREYDLQCIDLSGDFRLASREIYETWYGKAAPATAFLQEAVYGLTEIFAADIKQSRLISNPGCYPTAALLGLIPLVKNRLIDLGSIIIDGKTGVSGAGRSVSLGTHFSEVNENVKAYKIGSHQHIPEIEQYINAVLPEADAEKDVKVTFSAHLLPMTRGIMCTMYADLTAPVTTAELGRLYAQFYDGHPFVRVRPEGILPATKEVCGSNYCDIGIHADERTGRVTIVSVIDNLVKGAAGQAVQNMNVVNGWDVTAGLTDIPLYP
ncbi:N-acetyl-gamma-glutamyl-phosphate reductase [Evansella caseinilytica]|uniref:N-acetyl-gamma-glutamyl-phosphate reductase n=1 Tax=Evansella caseinilytica TaxID=1503961 RepID=A0A1H3RCG2_9BACI|nr:N-acetyl-gamma-glutamyl-phosphate reductase [Evansella caseinilytica]SDZ23336.1 N-acetyl-gamma-glutamyl-phosphate reductase [Evansella caseinilytica]